MTTTFFSEAEMASCALDISPDLTSETLQKNTKSVNLLLKAPIYFATSYDKNLTIEMFVSFARKIIPYKKIAFCMWDEPTNSMNLVFQRGFTDPQVNLLKTHAPFSTWVHTFEKPLLIREIDVQRQDIFQTLGFAEALIIPVSWEGKIRGGWQLFAPKPNTFSLNDIQLFWILTMQCELIFQNLTKREQIQKLAIVDSLTGLYNRRFFDSQLKKEIDRSQRNNAPLSLLMIDIDDFKHFNDQYSHQAGDYVLREIGSILPGNARTVDTICRYGGEEFSIILPSTDPVGAFLISERLRKAAESHSYLIEHNKYVHLTLSIGIACYPQMATTDSDLVRKADNALYEAKRLGKNRSIIFSPQITTTKQLDDSKQGISIGTVDFFMEGIRSLTDVSRLLTSLMHIIFPKLGKMESLYLEIDRKDRHAFLVSESCQTNTMLSEPYKKIPLATPLQGASTGWDTSKALTLEEKQQLRSFLPDSACYSWEKSIYRHCHRLSANRQGSLFIFLDEEHHEQQLSDAYTNDGFRFNEMISLISEGITMHQQQRSFCRLAAHKLIALSETALPYFKHHSSQVSRLLTDFAEALDLSEDMANTLTDTAYFYDLGLISISHDILLKDAPLNARERKICEQHPLLSWEIAKFSPKAVDPDKNAILHHHECFDGSGYPDHLSGSDIPLTARILALADTYAAMTSSRPYRSAMTANQALKEISSLAGSRFDPVLTQEFCSLIKAGHA